MNSTRYIAQQQNPAIMKYCNICIFSIIAALLLAGCVHTDDWALKTGDKLPSFKVKMNDGSLISTSDLEGKHSVIVFFNTGCGDCRRELPHIQQFYDYCRNNMPDVVLLCISREQSDSEIETYWKENGLTLPYSAQPDRKLYSKFATMGIPRIFVSGKNLVITDTFDDTNPPTAEQLIELLQAMQD